MRSRFALALQKSTTNCRIERINNLSQKIGVNRARFMQNQHADKSDTLCNACAES